MHLLIIIRDPSFTLGYFYNYRLSQSQSDGLVQETRNCIVNGLELGYISLALAHRYDSIVKVPVKRPKATWVNRYYGPITVTS